MASTYRLISTRGWGSAIIEAALALGGFAYELEELDPNRPKDRQRLLSLNPLGQIPVLILPDGELMTESAAMLLLLSERQPATPLAPPPGAPERAAFLRWLAFVVAAIYPQYIVGDGANRLLPGDADAAARLLEATDAQMMRHWQQIEAAITPSPWFLGQTFSVLDLYVVVMVRWRPGRAWFAAHCPKLTAVAAATARLPKVEAIMRAQFD
ncbi:GST-like protein [Arboricoccus pini]|uniref:GST-like protein n=1 Tax=Arboricoccus pini TaxID=1963835 RepID=A0A212RW42_9PROT|nr:glutathione S-transferase family protein [Arboricoccus pini]SNB76802.1 GST-like protein [Arboricoccus pini]